MSETGKCYVQDMLYPLSPLPDRVFGSECPRAPNPIKFAVQSLYATDSHSRMWEVFALHCLVLNPSIAAVVSDQLLYRKLTYYSAESSTYIMVSCDYAATTTNG
jgi:hypothetical protein